VASKADRWRHRIALRLADHSGVADPKSALLADAIGQPSSELLARLEAPSREAAVLLPLLLRPTGIHLLLTERAAHLEHHPGQISFPGGRLAAGETPVQAALREAEEEVAIPRSSVQVLGQLPQRLTGTGFAVTPVVGWLHSVGEFEPDPSEVQSVFEAPLTHLLDAGNRSTGHRERYGTLFRVFEYRFDRYRIWGATAAILTEFFEVIDAKTI